MSAPPPSRARAASPGAHPDDDGTTFVVWTTRAKRVEVRLFGQDGAPTRDEALAPDGEEPGRYARHLAGVGPGALYKFVLDGEEVPDPYARFLPFGVHGAARVEAPERTPALTEPPPPEGFILYELHVGTFTPEGTYRAAEARLDALVDLGITAIELMPLASFPGARGWGYDGVSLYAPHASYGEPNDLRAFVRAAHARGIAVVLDVVYNHFGPSGNYLWRYAEEYFDKNAETPWGPAPDYGHAPMRRVALENVRYWLEEFGFDGLRLDATHEIVDPSSRHVLREITDLAHAMSPPRRVFFEDERNDPMVLRDLGADAVWADDFHHQVHVLLTNERDGYYAAYEPTVTALARTIERGWTYEGEAYPPWEGRPRGKRLRGTGVRPDQLVYCVQNHDQVGNRALGTRLCEHTDVDRYIAASALLLFLPATPLILMGQEWASSSPFLFFSDHEGELAEAVRRGRREEFKAFAAFADPEARSRIPDPQAAATFERSKLRWEEREREEHLRVLDAYRALIAFRRTDPVLRAASSWGDVRATAQGGTLEVLRRQGAAIRRLFAAFGDDELPAEVREHRTGRVLFETPRAIIVAE